MAPSDDDGVDSVKFGPSTGLQGSKIFGKNTQGKVNIGNATSHNIKDNLDGEKVCFSSNFA